MESLLWPLLPVLPVLGVPGVLGSVDGDLERLSARRPWVLRVGALLCCVVVLAVVCALGSRFDLTVVCRNAAFLLGVAVWATVVLRPSYRWQPLVLGPVLMWLVGTDEHRRIRPWDVLLLPGDRSAPLIVALITFVTGAVAYVVRPVT